MMATGAFAITSVIDSFCTMPFLAAYIVPNTGMLGGRSVLSH